MSTGVLLLAAGASRRFGSDKRRAQLADGRALLQATIGNIETSALPLRVCLGAGDEMLAGELRTRGTAVIHCPDAALGMGHTLAEAVSQRPGDWSAVIIALGDMPWVRPATYRAIAGKLTPDTIVVPCHNGARGNPVGFGSVFLPGLERCSGDRGARDILRDNVSALYELPVDDAGIHRDVDSVTDLDY